MLNFDISRASLIAQGASGQVFQLPDDRVLKLFHPAASDEMIAREAAMSDMACNLALPVAAPLGQVEIDGRKGIIYRRLRGETILQAVIRHPWRGPALLDILAQLQAAVHNRPASGIRSVGEVLDTDIRYGPASLELQRAACAYLRMLPEGSQLLHGDFHPGNVILTADGPFIIDWAKAAMGVPAADVARTEMLLRFGQGREDVATSIWRDWAARRVTRYSIETNITSAAEIQAWRPVVALAWLRARAPVRQRSFLRYLGRALEAVGLPAII